MYSLLQLNPRNSLAYVTDGDYRAKHAAALASPGSFIGLTLELEPTVLEISKLAEFLALTCADKLGSLVIPMGGYTQWEDAQATLIEALAAKRNLHILALTNTEWMRIDLVDSPERRSILVSAPD